MVTYNPKDWFKLIFRFHKSDTIRILFPAMVLLGIVTAGACYAEKKYIQTPIPSLTIFHQISGFIISLVLVFRINTAYDRWWEGRKLWGSLLNNSRNMALKLSAMLPADDHELRQGFANQISNFALALKNHLRNKPGTEEMIFLSPVTEEAIKTSGHRPSYVAGGLYASTLEVCKKHPQSSNDYLILSAHINEMIDICGSCERIQKTPIPYSYSIFIKKFVFLYIITMPLSFGLTIGYWSVPIVMIMFYAFASLELLSEEIEDPFGTDANDLPTDEISERIRINVNEILMNHAR
jgi:ion channel-forming bestrophin family protein